MGKVVLLLLLTGEAKLHRLADLLSLVFESTLRHVMRPILRGENMPRVVRTVAQGSHRGSEFLFEQFLNLL